MKAYSYIRFSTKDQIHGDSLRRQTEATAKWCQSNGVELVDNYRDLGLSAFKGKNAEVGMLAAFLKLARAGRIEKGSFLVVESLDRLSRNSIMTAFDLFRDIMKAGVKIVTLSDGHIYDLEKINGGAFTDLIISLTFLSRANEESRLKSERVGAAWRNKQLHAKDAKLTKMGPAWLQLREDRKRFEPIPDRARTVKRIYELARDGMGPQSIAKVLNKAGTATFTRSKSWHISYVRRILDNRSVIGDFTPGIHRNGGADKLDAVPGYYPAVVSRELFATVQQIKQSRPDMKGKASPRNVFSKLAFDTKGSTVIYVNKSPGGRPHTNEYLISYGALLGKVPYITWRYDEFLASFLAVCQRAALTKAPEVGQDNGELAVTSMELDDTEKQIGRLVDILARGGSAAIESKMRELETKKQELQHSITDLENQAAAKPMNVAKVDWKDTEALRENLRATVKRITIDAKARWFRSEFLDGRVYEFQQDKNKVTITSPDL